MPCSQSQDSATIKVALGTEHNTRPKPSFSPSSASSSSASTSSSSSSAPERDLLLECVHQMRQLNERPAEVWDLAHLARSCSKLNVTHVQQVVGLMSFTKGTDKILKFFQYLAMLGKDFFSYSEFFNMLSHQVSQSVAARNANLEEQLSRVRKTLRLFKCLKEVQSIREIASGKDQRPLVDRLIDIGTHVSSGLYYMLDHILWAVNVCVLRMGKVERATYKRFKNIASILRLGFRFVQIANSPNALRNEERELWTKFESVLCAPTEEGQTGSAKPMTPEEQRHEIRRLAHLLRMTRAKKYFLMLDMAEWYMNFTILGSALRWFAPHRLIVGFCGVASSLIGIYRLWLTAYHRPAELVKCVVPLPAAVAAAASSLQKEGRVTVSVPEALAVAAASSAVLTPSVRPGELVGEDETDDEDDGDDDEEEEAFDDESEDESEEEDAERSQVSSSVGVDDLDVGEAPVIPPIHPPDSPVARRTTLSYHECVTPNRQFVKAPDLSSREPLFIPSPGDRRVSPKSSSSRRHRPSFGPIAEVGGLEVVPAGTSSLAADLAGVADPDSSMSSADEGLSEEEEPPDPWQNEEAWPPLEATSVRLWTKAKLIRADTMDLMRQAEQNARILQV